MAVGCFGAWMTSVGRLTLRVARQRFEFAIRVPTQE
jgi:hypothetical protein